MFVKGGKRKYLVDLNSEDFKYADDSDIDLSDEEQYQNLYNMQQLITNSTYNVHYKVDLSQHNHIDDDVVVAFYLLDKKQ